jgi:hypothetical protein
MSAPGLAPHAAVTGVGASGSPFWRVASSSSVKGWFDMGLLQLGLTIAAWRKGWRAKALLPLAGVLVVGVLLAAVVRASGGGVAEIRGLGFLGDVGGVVALGFMARRGPRVGPAALASSLAPSAALEVQATGRAAA